MSLLELLRHINTFDQASADTVRDGSHQLLLQGPLVVVDGKDVLASRFLLEDGLHNSCQVGDVDRRYEVLTLTDVGQSRRLLLPGLLKMRVEDSFTFAIEDTRGDNVGLNGRLELLFLLALLKGLFDATSSSNLGSLGLGLEHLVEVQHFVFDLLDDCVLIDGVAHLVVQLTERFILRSLAIVLRDEVIQVLVLRLVEVGVVRLLFGVLTAVFLSLRRFLFLCLSWLLFTFSGFGTLALTAVAFFLDLFYRGRSLLDLSGSAGPSHEAGD